MYARSLKMVTALLVPVAALSGPARGGELNPPAGPVAPTMKNLETVEPRTPINSTNTPGDANSIYRITQPGSYYLTGNLTAAAAKHGIKIEASGVVVDLRGFEFNGATYTGINAIFVSGVRANIVIRNGSMRGWIQAIEASAADNMVISDMLASDCGVGISIRDRGQIRNCIAANMGDNNCFAVRNNCALDNCIAFGSGEPGIHALDGNVITNCLVAGNGENGMLLGAHNSVVGCAALDNTDAGINASGSSSIRDCVALGNDVGFVVRSGSSISGCVASENSRLGILASDRCSVTNNRCIDNGPFTPTAGILVELSGSRVMDNDVQDNTGPGINVSGDGNLVIRNYARNNATNYQIGAGNTAGPIVNSINVGTNNSPNANYEY